MTYPIHLPNITIYSVEENWKTDSVFDGTFSGSREVNLCSVSIEIGDSQTYEEFTLSIEPNQPGHYGSYSETGQGVSNEILVTIIGLLTAPENTTTVQSFIENIVEQYSVDYTVKVNNVIQNRLIYVKESIMVPKGYSNVVKVTDLFKFKQNYSLNGEILGELNETIPFKYYDRFNDLNHYLVNNRDGFNSVVVIVPDNNISSVSSAHEGNTGIHVVTNSSKF